MIAGAPLIGVGVPVKILRHDAKTYKVIAVPKSAVPEPLLRVKEVVMVLSVPQLNTAITVEARKWTEKVRHVYFLTRKPYSDYLTRLAEQGYKELVMLQIAPNYNEKTGRGGRT